jgi:pimeloyl-ACP methyl ester carboxylesterase
MGEPAEHEDNPAAAMFPAIRDNAIAMREEGLDDEAAAARLSAAPMRDGATAGDLMMDDGLLARAHAHLVMDPEVLTMAADNRTLGETDVDAPVGVPVLILAAGVQAAFKPEHEARMKETHPDVTVVRVAGAGHGIHDEKAHRADYVERLTAFLAQHAPVGARA